MAFFLGILYLYYMARQWNVQIAMHKPCNYSPRSNGCVKKVAKQLALPPNQNGYCTGFFSMGFTSSLLRSSGRVTLLMTWAILTEGGCTVTACEAGVGSSRGRGWVRCGAGKDAVNRIKPFKTNDKPMRVSVVVKRPRIRHTRTSSVKRAAFGVKSGAAWSAAWRSRERFCGQPRTKNGPFR